MANIFSSVRVTRPNRTAFSLSHSNLFTSEFGRLTPVCCLDGVPGDTFNLNAASLVRFSPMLAPPFGSVNSSLVWFAVPMRLVNAKFTKMITGYYQNTAGSSQFLKRPNMCFNFSVDSSSPQQGNLAQLNRYYTRDDYARYNLLDYLGIRTGVDGQAPQNDRIECARWLAYWYVYFEYFVDQNLGYRPSIADPSKKIRLRSEDGTVMVVDSILNWEQFTQVILYASGRHPAVGGYLTIGDCIQHGKDIDVYVIWDTDLFDWFFRLPQVCWPKDYFTSALPWAQRGEPVTVPINVDGNSSGLSVGFKKDGLTPDFLVNTTDGSTGLGALSSNTGTLTAGNKPATLDNSQNLVVKGDGGSVMSFTINDLRTSYALQSWLEKNSRCGSRYIEQILSHFGVRSSDARLQRPEYLGGFKNPVHVTSVAQTSENGMTPQGNLAGNAISAGAGRRITYFCEEHILLMCFHYVQLRPVYSQGMSRLLKRREFYDFYFPEFAHLGEQAIMNGELYYDPTKGSAGNEETFGYQSRYSEYKFMNNEVHGDFLHDSLNSWLFGNRIFGEQPTLSPEFLQVDPAIEPSLLNAFPVIGNGAQDAPFDKLYCQIDFDIKALRPMPKYGTPYL